MVTQTSAQQRERFLGNLFYVLTMRSWEEEFLGGHCAHTHICEYSQCARLITTGQENKDGDAMTPSSENQATIRLQSFAQFTVCEYTRITNVWTRARRRNRKKPCTNGSGVNWAQHRANSEMCLSE